MTPFLGANRRAFIIATTAIVLTSIVTFLSYPAIPIHGTSTAGTIPAHGQKFVAPAVAKGPEGHWNVGQLSGIDMSRSVLPINCTTRQSCKMQKNDYWFTSHSAKISGCLINKAGSSTLRKIFFRLAGAPDWNDPKMREGRIHELSSMLTRQNASMALPREYKLFAFVRDPFKRIVSFYHSKVLPMHPFYFKTLVIPILARYQKGEVTRSPVVARERGIVVQFSSLIRYILEKRLDDTHWAPMCSLCPFCQMEFNFIGRIENAAVDLPKLAAYLGVPMPSHTYSTLNTSYDDVIGHFRDIDRSLVEQLVQKYRTDYELFRYPLPTTYLPQFNIP